MFKKMIKRFKKFKLYDWTIISVLCVLTIISFIYVLRFPKTKGNGMFQCFYNKDGVLMQQNLADNNYLTPKPAPNGVCTFKVPPEIEIISVTLIAGGGGGSASQIATGQRSFDFNPETTEISLVDESFIARNPFVADIKDTIFKEKVLNELTFKTQGGHGADSKKTDAKGGLGGVCEIKGADLQIWDEIIRKAGKDGLDDKNGEDGFLTFKRPNAFQINMTAKGGLSYLNTAENKNGECSDKKYASSPNSNTSAKNETFYKNFSVTKLVAEKKQEKIRVLRGVAGYRGETVDFDMKAPKGQINICAKKGEKCHAYVGFGGAGGITPKTVLSSYSEDISGKSGGDTVFQSKSAKGGMGGNPRREGYFYLQGFDLFKNGDNGNFYANYEEEGAKGGDCKRISCNGEDAKTIGASGAGAGLLYKTDVPLRQIFAIKIKDEKERQIGADILLNEADKINDESNFMMGNGGAGMGGAIIIRW